MHDAWAWHEIRTHLRLNDSQREELAGWEGSPEGFINMLRERCGRHNGGNREVCEEYR
jgi:hypothetical protein